MSIDYDLYADLTDTPVDDYSGLCAIAYDDDYKKAIGFLRELIAANEYSERALLLTEFIINKNAAHYTIWSYRLEICKRIGRDLSEELKWTDQLAIDKPKNYQIWPYKQLLIKLIDSYDPLREFPLIEAMLLDDSKNYHVWSFRQWLVSRFNLWKDERELQFVDKMLERDVRNNSAWNHRFFIVFKAPGGPLSEDVNKEINYAKKEIKKLPPNQSSWNYLLGIYKYQKLPLKELEEFALSLTPSQILNPSEEYPKKESCISIQALDLLSMIYAEEQDKKDLSVRLLDALSTEYDVIRKEYWNHRKTGLV